MDADYVGSKDDMKSTSGYWILHLCWRKSCNLEQQKAHYIARSSAEENMAHALGICLRLLENNRSSDSVRNTAAATFRQAVALIFDHVVCAESLPTGKFGSGGYVSRTNSVTSDVSRNIKRLESQGEAIILEILKGYQAFTQACGVLHAVEPLNSFLASLCKFTIYIPNEAEKRRCIDVAGAYSAQKTELNISLTAIGLLWTATDFIVKGLTRWSEEGFETDQRNYVKKEEATPESHEKVTDATYLANTVERDKLLFSVFSLLHKLGADERPEILQRLISTLDRCASRTCCLPLETVELMPPHCSRFSLTCLQKLFSLSSYEVSDWNSARSEVSKISIRTLMSRCDFILRKFLADENDLGKHSLPPARLDEVIFVLQELAGLVIHPETASSLPLHPHLQEGVSLENLRSRSHLLVLFPSFCELVVSRYCYFSCMIMFISTVTGEAPSLSPVQELRVRELVQVLLRLIAAELGLQKLDFNVKLGCVKKRVSTFAR
ncbi:hypothetical protein Sango_2841500 [Sesamum angolense]|uniref:Mon2 C-terminal domain-containing protein n=1 Tax=Sesamum angolense TaxID=2727404 RepID=A0AAE1T6X8_9LAMI|nr:hypothetical protein Sango_2841500 [Sesamum angolense]